MSWRTTLGLALLAAALVSGWSAWRMRDRSEPPPVAAQRSDYVLRDFEMVMLANDGCALPHQSPLTQALPAAANWRDEVFGVTSEPAVIVYNRNLIPPGDAPESRFDLLDLLALT